MTLPTCFCAGCLLPQAICEIRVQLPDTINMLFITCYFWGNIESFLLKLIIGSFLSLLGGWSPREDTRRQKLLSKRLQKWTAFQPQLCFLTLQRYVPHILVLHLAGTSLFGLVVLLGNASRAGLHQQLLGWQWLLACGKCWVSKVIKEIKVRTQREVLFVCFSQ